jgi:hypothetical protein
MPPSTHLELDPGVLSRQNWNAWSGILSSSRDVKHLHLGRIPNSLLPHKILTTPLTTLSNPYTRVLYMPLTHTC